MAVGILKKGFVVHNHVYRIRLPKGSMVTFYKQNNIPTIIFNDIPVRFIKINGQWFCDFYGTLMLIQFPKNDLPYPMSYFK